MDPLHQATVHSDLETQREQLTPAFAKMQFNDHCGAGGNDADSRMPRTMDSTTLYYAIAAVLAVIGLIGTVLPALPGLPLIFGSQSSLMRKFDDQNLLLSVNTATQNSLYQYKLSDGTISKKMDVPGLLTGLAKLD